MREVLVKFLLIYLQVYHHSLQYGREHQANLQYL